MTQLRLREVIRFCSHSTQQVKQTAALQHLLLLLLLAAPILIKLTFCSES